MEKTYNAALIRRVQEYMEKHSISQNQLAAKVNLSSAALSSYLNQKYKGSVEAVERQLTEFFKMWRMIWRRQGLLLASCLQSLSARWWCRRLMLSVLPPTAARTVPPRRKRPLRTALPLSRQSAPHETNWNF